MRYVNPCRSLFEKDKLLFSFILCTTIMIAKRTLTRQELNFFLTGGVGLENRTNRTPNPGKPWLPDKSWDEVRHWEKILCKFTIITGNFVSSLQS